MSVNIFVPGHHDHPDAMNVSNSNFVRLLRLIGLEINPQDLYGPPHHGTLYELASLRVQLVIALQAIHDLPELDAGTGPRVVTDEELAEPGAAALAKSLGALVIDCGWPPGYIAQRLGQLLRLVEWAMREGERVEVHMTTSINGQPAEWSQEIWRLWYTYVERADPKLYDSHGLPSRANYFTPRPWKNEWDRGDRKEGFTFVVGRGVYQVVINDGGIAGRIAPWPTPIPIGEL